MPVPVECRGSYATPVTAAQISNSAKGDWEEAKTNTAAAFEAIADKIRGEEAKK